MKKTAKLLRFLPVLLILLVALSGCLAGKAVKGADQDAVLAYAEPMADNVLNAIEANDYAAFSQDFSDEMKTAIDETAFQDLREMLSGKVGSYQSRSVSSVRDVDGILAVIYTAVYSKDDQVVITLSVTADEPYQVTGLYFTSPELRK